LILFLFLLYFSADAREGETIMTTRMFYAEEQKRKTWLQVVKFYEIAAEERGLECPAPRQLKELIEKQGFTKTFTDIFKSNASSVHQKLKKLYMEGDDYCAFVALTRDARRRRVKRINLTVATPNIEWASNNSNYYFTDLSEVDSSAIYVSFPQEGVVRVRVADLYLLHSILFVD
jgi:hypothetical protein